MPPMPPRNSSHAAPPSPETQREPATESPPSPFAILVAIAGDECTTPAVQVAEALATQRGATPSLLYVMELTPVITPEGGLGTAVLTQMLLDPVQHTKDERALRASCHVDTGLPATWPFTLDLGNAASSIMLYAQQQRAHLIVMGLHHHGTIDHLLADDTLRNVMATGTTPVLAVRPELHALPERIVVAMDFSVASVRAARLARQLLADHGTMHLVFVESVEDDVANEREQGRRLTEAHGVETAFQQVCTVLEPGPGMTIVSSRRFGNPIDELKAACEEIHPDVVAIGSQRHPFFQRLFLGTVTKAIVGDGRWSVLVTPPGAR